MLSEKKLRQIFSYIDTKPLLAIRQPELEFSTDFFYCQMIKDGQNAQNILIKKPNSGFICKRLRNVSKGEKKWRYALEKGWYVCENLEPYPERIRDFEAEFAKFSDEDIIQLSRQLSNAVVAQLLPSFSLYSGIWHCRMENAVILPVHLHLLYYSPTRPSSDELETIVTEIS